MAHLTLVLGGARSGKSARALAIAEEVVAGTGGSRLFVATAEALDDEIAERIALHRAERGVAWAVAEAPLEPGAALAGLGDGDVAVVDCLTLWLSNLMHHERDAEAATVGLLQAAAAARGRAIFVSNEIGMGLAPMNALGRAFRDAQGRLNQRVAAAAHRVEFVAAGLPLVLKDG
ncbi:MAG: bifunctional adenosylcobinamide kinase/adenosylcobinamide-phosphate guanylyltransferase [Pseudomonadota bacterium]